MKHLICINTKTCDKDRHSRRQRLLAEIVNKNFCLGKIRVNPCTLQNYALCKILLSSYCRKRRMPVYDTISNLRLGYIF